MTKNSIKKIVWMNYDNKKYFLKKSIAKNNIIINMVKNVNIIQMK
jgi:hypothetical protein